MGTILGLMIAFAGFIGGGVLISQDSFDLGMLVIIAGGVLGFWVAWVTQYLALGKAVWDWVQIMRRNPDSVHVVSVHPPKGFIIRRDAVVTMDVADEGATTRMEHAIPIPWLPAFFWRVAGRVPTPIGRLTDKRDLNAKVWGRRGGEAPG